MAFHVYYTDQRKKWHFSGEVILGCGKEEDRWLYLITRGMTTLLHAKRTSRIVSCLMVIGIKGRVYDMGDTAVQYIPGERVAAFSNPGIDESLEAEGFLQTQMPSNLLRGDFSDSLCGQRGLATKEALPREHFLFRQSSLSPDHLHGRCGVVNHALGPGGAGQTTSCCLRFCTPIAERF